MKVVNIIEKHQHAGLSRLVTFILLFPFWLLLSGHYDLFHISLGIICCLLVAYFFHDLLFENIMAKNKISSIRRFIVYLPWLIYKIITANIHVAYLVLHPKMPIDPKIIQFKTKLSSDIAKVVLGNSITLTPGTITMDIIDGEFYVHALSKSAVSDLLTHEMERKVAHVFLENEDSDNIKQHS